MSETVAHGSIQPDPAHPDPAGWIDAWLDETLADEDCPKLEAWIRADARNAAQFADRARLHDRLRAELLASSSAVPELVATDTRRRGPRGRWRSVLVAAALAIVTLVGVLFPWREGRLSAATRELDRLIAAQSSAGNRTYRIHVDAVAPDERIAAEPGKRPPKPPLEGAELHIGGGGRWALVRTTVDGARFATGCDGQMGWAVAPTGPVRTSGDKARFHRDLPGHEHELTLDDPHQALVRLRSAYDLEWVVASDGERRMLLATKRRGERGPERVELLYLPEGSRIDGWRFEGMPYGPERLTIRVVPVTDTNPTDAMFLHTTHHPADRPVVEE